jgi:hypothetical protein
MHHKIGGFVALGKPHSTFSFKLERGNVGSRVRKNVTLAAMKYTPYSAKGN